MNGNKKLFRKGVGIGELVLYVSPQTPAVRTFGEIFKFPRTRLCIEYRTPKGKLKRIWDKKLMATEKGYEVA